MTRREEPRELKPAVRAKGTVRPSAKPMMKSRTRSLWVEWCSLWVDVAGVGADIFSLSREVELEGIGWIGEVEAMIGSTERQCLATLVQDVCEAPFFQARQEQMREGS